MEAITANDPLTPLLTRRMTTATVRTMMQRRAEFSCDLEAALTGVAMSPDARARLDGALDRVWPTSTQVYGARVPEVIIGSGFHAAVYAAGRVRAGLPKPLVLERGPRAGGVFAQPGGPAFYLNSRNRPGGLGLAGDQGINPNYLPGAPIQTANLSVGDYQTNDDMAFIIRLTLARYADVVTDYEVVSVQGSGTYRLDAADGSYVRARRVIDARGVGDPKGGEDANGRNVVTFPQFMQRMAGVWPLRGVRRAAVIGGGDAARCAIEALLGLGPQPPMTIPMLDSVERVDAYGQLPTTCERWAEAERGRYAPIGRFLRADRYGTRRLNVTRTRSARAVALADTALVRGRAYDLVVIATGSRDDGLTGLPIDDFQPYSFGGVPLAQRQGNVWRVGPCANLPFTGEEENGGVADIENNRVSMFRLASKTATLAATLPSPRGL